MTSKIRTTRAMLAAFAIAALVAPAPGRADTPVVGTLGVGDSVFWDGPFVEDAGLGTRDADPVVCRGATGNMFSCSVPLVAGVGAGLAEDITSQECDPPACIEYFLDLVREGTRLRVALDHPDIRDSFQVGIYDPTGGSAASSGGVYSMEPFVDHPAPGRWTVRVILLDVEDSAFRMRAVLEQASTPPAVPQALLPNLRATPPFDLVFGGCQASEIVQYNPARCLRFSAGPANVGDGPLDLRISWEDCFGYSCIVATTGVNWQWVHYSDGSFRVRPAGTYEWHAAHQHYHHVGTADYRLFRVVDDQAGELAPAGQGPKIGFCMGDYLIADWRSFDQDARNSGMGRCVGTDAPLGTRMGLTKGWGDIYGYYTEGNFVDFGTNPDGLYVVRVATDPGNSIAELVEGDNHGYAYIRVTGDNIEVLERGYGMSPWDPAKVVADDIRHPTE